MMKLLLTEIFLFLWGCTINGRLIVKRDEIVAKKMMVDKEDYEAEGSGFNDDEDDDDILSINIDEDSIDGSFSFSTVGSFSTLNNGSFGTINNGSFGTINNGSFSTINNGSFNTLNNGSFGGGNFSFTGGFDKGGFGKGESFGNGGTFGKGGNGKFSFERQPESREVAENVYSFTSSGFIISLFMVTNEGVMVIDPFTEKHSKLMLEAIRTMFHE